MKTYTVKSDNSKTIHKVKVNEETKSVSTNNQMIRILIKEFLSGKEINQGYGSYSTNSKGYYISCIDD